jgi:hypothetical protein
MIPGLFGKEPLDGSDGNLGLEGNGFTVFSWEVGNQPGRVNTEIVSSILVWNAGFESSEQSCQIGSDFSGIGSVHSSVLREGKLHNGRILQYFYHSEQYQSIAL